VPPNPLRWLSDAELDELEQAACRRAVGVAGQDDVAREAAIRDACSRRIAAGEPPWADTPRAEEARELERVIYWTELLPPALRSGAAIDYGRLHRDARRLAAERLQALAPRRG
jgi:hypothetical protein